MCVLSIKVSIRSLETYLMILIYVFIIYSQVIYKIMRIFMSTLMIVAIFPLGNISHFYTEHLLTAIVFWIILTYLLFLRKSPQNTSWYFLLYWIIIIKINFILYMKLPLLLWSCSWCKGYRRRKWTRQHEFKTWTRLIAFHIALIPLGKVWIRLFSLQLWVNRKADWVVQPWLGN